MKAEQELIEFLEHIGKTYDLSNEDYFNLEAWIQTIEGLGFGVNKNDKSIFIGERITDFYCNGFFGRRYDLIGSVIIDVGSNYITIRDQDGDVDTATFENGWQLNDMYKLLEDWTNWNIS